jgi:hypothetical protein
MKMPISSSVGPKPSSRFARNERPSSGGLAFTVTSFSRRSFESSSVFANDGTSVSKKREVFWLSPDPG